MNRLAKEKSPYLLQHANNPVDWYAWNEEAFEKARTENKPIFLSIGYSTCHWCHVMERESFESEEIAKVLNDHFVPIKVDREERPDVDRIYMSFVQASTGGGGWPMSVWLTPDLKPFFGGTYYPPDNRWGRPGFKYILEQLAKTWSADRERVVQSSEDVVRQLEDMSRVASDTRTIIDQTIFDSAYFQFRRMFDSRLGGFGRAPKFPRVVAHNFLLRYYYQTKVEEACEMVLTTLREMAKGGMYDQLGGGFHRYSVDDRWFVPHFEKMLYDQGQLAVSYLEGYQVSGDESLVGVARGIFEYVLRDMTDAGGGFYSAEDADSVIDPAHPHEKGEGAFYVWTKEEVESVLGPERAAWFNRKFGVEPGGNVTEDPHGEFTGKNILYQARDVDVAPEELARATAELLEARAKRVRPHLDDKILTSWNGLMITAFAKGAQVLDDERYANAAKRAADFILGTMWDGSTLLRRYRQGEAAIPGFLDDYAFFAQALLDLYEAVFDIRYLDEAVRICERMMDLFEDEEHGGFYSTAEGDAALVMRLKEDYDGAEPSGNSIAALILLRLAHITGNQRFRRSAERTVEAFGSRLKQTPTGVPQMMVAAMCSAIPGKQVVLAGSRDGVRPFLREMHRRFLPWHEVLRVESDAEREKLSKYNDAVGVMREVDGQPAAYVCENFTCQLPVRSVEEFVQLLQ
jgi:uncharacterized protein YyaL (SSP411 family)